jgi:uncharacterized protein (UPF0548 family)
VLDTESDRKIVDYYLYLREETSKLEDWPPTADVDVEIGLLRDQFERIQFALVSAGKLSDWLVFIRGEEGPWVMYVIAVLGAVNQSYTGSALSLGDTTLEEFDTRIGQNFRNMIRRMKGE